MNVATRDLLERALVILGGDSVGLGSGSIGLIAAPFAPTPILTLADITEATFTGYTRKTIGNPTVPFTGGDGLYYVEGTTNQWIPSDTVTPNSIRGAFVTFGSDTTKAAYFDAFGAPITMAGPQNQITITPRFGFDPAGNFGLNVVSS